MYYHGITIFMEVVGEKTKEQIYGDKIIILYQLAYYLAVETLF